jgi:uncharacterized protein YegP (UPF0339 family)
MKFEIHKSKDRQFYFILKARNGQVIATSETYKTKESCKKGIKSIRRNVFARIFDLT